MLYALKFNDIKPWVLSWLDNNRAIHSTAYFPFQNLGKLVADIHGSYIASTQDCTKDRLHQMSLDHPRTQAIDNPAYNLTIAFATHPAEHANNFHRDAPREVPPVSVDLFQPAMPIWRPHESVLPLKVLGAVERQDTPCASSKPHNLRNPQSRLARSNRVPFPDPPSIPAPAKYNH
ncbi:hypothetical protein N9Z58_00860 [bacterium]|nr:hypothetical protein [bacterium]